MKKVKLTESQLDMISKNQRVHEQQQEVNEVLPAVAALLAAGWYAFSSTNRGKEGVREMFNFAKTWTKTTASESFDYNGACVKLYDAIDGIGTDEDKVASVFNGVVGYGTLRKLIESFQRKYGKDLFQWLADDFSGSDWTTYIYAPLDGVREAHEKLKADELAKAKADNDAQQAAANETELYKSFIQKFPCLKDEPGFKYVRENADTKVMYFQTTSNPDITDYGIKEDGSLYYYADGWQPAPEKASCNSAQYQDIAEGFSYGGISAGDQGTADQGTVTQSTATQASADQGAKTPIRYMTNDDVKQIQDLLISKGFGEIVGSPDGKLGPKTLAGIKAFMLGGQSTTTDTQSTGTTDPAAAPAGAAAGMGGGAAAGASAGTQAVVSEAYKSFKRFIK